MEAHSMPPSRVPYCAGLIYCPEKIITQELCPISIILCSRKPYISLHETETDPIAWGLCVPLLLPEDQDVANARWLSAALCHSWMTSPYFHLLLKRTACLCVSWSVNMCWPLLYFWTSRRRHFLFYRWGHICGTSAEYTDLGAKNSAE